MNEKRFTFGDDGLTIYDAVKNDHIGFDDDLEDLLNELHEENQSLKKQLDDTIDLLSKEINSSENAFEGLLKENEQLKQQIKDLRLEVLDSLHDADDIQCSCNPCVVEECVKRVVE